MQGRLPLTAAAPGGAAPTGTVDPEAEADRVARTLADLAARLRGGNVFDTAPTPVAGGQGDAPNAPAPRFTAPPRAPSDGLADIADGPRILNGGGAGSFHRAPQAVP